MKHISLLRLCAILAVALLGHACSKHDLSGCRKPYIGSSSVMWNDPWDDGVVFDPANDSIFALLRNNTIYLINLTDTSAAYTSATLPYSAAALLAWCNNNTLCLSYGGRIYSANPDGTMMTLLTVKSSLEYALPFTCVRPIYVRTNYTGPGGPILKDNLRHFHVDSTYSQIDTIYDICNYSVNADGRLAVAYNSKFVNIYNASDQLIATHRLIADENLIVRIKALCWAGNHTIAWADDSGIYLTDTDTWATSLLQAAHDDAEYLNLSSSNSGLFVAATYKTYHCDNYTELLENANKPELHIINTQSGEDRLIGNF